MRRGHRKSISRRYAGAVVRESDSRSIAAGVPDADRRRGLGQRCGMDYGRMRCCRGWRKPHGQREVGGFQNHHCSRKTIRRENPKRSRMTTTMNKKIVTFGEIMLRLAAPGAERFLQSPRFDATFGGGEANVAIALASFGMCAVYVSALPEKNPIADAAIAQLRGLGVDTSQIVRGKGRMGIYFLEAGANQRPSRVVYDRESSAIALAKPSDVDWK